MSPSDLGAIPLGERVTVRHRLPDGRASDAVGTLTARDATSVTLRTRRGEVRIPLAAVVVHRRVRPTPWRIGTFLRRAGVVVVGLGAVVGTAGDGQHPRPVAATVALLDELVAAGVPVLVLADRPDRAAGQLDHLGLGHLVPCLLGTGAAVHARIEERLGRAVDPAEVHLTDPAPAEVDSARARGWQARVFTLPG